MFSPIDYIGISTNLPTDIKFFKEELFSTSRFIKDNQPKIKKIISISIDSKIISTKIINTSKKVSNDGQKLSGKKLLVELNINYKIKYLSTNKEKCLYILKHNITKIIYIVIPSEVDNKTIEEIIRKKRMGIKTYIEDLYADIRDNEEIYIRNLILVNVFIKNK